MARTSQSPVRIGGQAIAIIARNSHEQENPDKSGSCWPKRVSFLTHAVHRPCCVPYKGTPWSPGYNRSPSVCSGTFLKSGVSDWLLCRRLACVPNQSQPLRLVRGRPVTACFGPRVSDTTRIDICRIPWTALPPIVDNLHGIVSGYRGSSHVTTAILAASQPPPPQMNALIAALVASVRRQHCLSPLATEHLRPSDWPPPRHLLPATTVSTCSILQTRVTS